MSIIGSFFNRGFMASKCKTLLKLTIPRIKLLRNRREIQLKQMRRDIAKLLETGQEATARIRVEHIIREENMIAAQEIIELFCELIVVRLPIIESQRECPLDLKEAISSICFAAPRCADLPELLQVQLLFSTKYGKEFVSAATELMPDSGVNRQLVGRLSVHAPSPEKRLNLLKEIAAEHEIDWDPTASETELFKKQEDLLNGPTQIPSEPKLILPYEKNNEESYSAASQPDQEQLDSEAALSQPNREQLDSEAALSQPNLEHADSDSVSDTSEFPEVPQARVLSNVNIATTPNMAKLEPVEERSVIYKDEPQTSGKVDNKQFVPFISPPLAPLESFSIRHSDSLPSLEKNKSGADVDLQDVLDAAHAAAETAEHAAAAARSAARLAESRINELTKKSSEHKPDNTSENPFYADSSHQSATIEMGSSNEQNTATEYGGKFMEEQGPVQDYNAAHSTDKFKQAHMSDRTKKNSLHEPDDTSENPFYTASYHQSATTEKGRFNEQNTIGVYGENFMNEPESYHDYNAAQSAASFEQVHISDGTKKSSLYEPSDASENPFYTNSANQSSTEWRHFAEKNTAGDYDDDHGMTMNELETRQANKGDFTGQKSSSLPSYETLDDKSSASLRGRSLPSMEDDLYASYNNLFTFPNSNKGSQNGSDHHHYNA